MAIATPPSASAISARDTMKAPAAPAPKAVSSAKSQGLMREVISPLVVNEMIKLGTIHDNR